jgi:bifunctional non-homologous end joining protein LigD
MHASTARRPFDGDEWVFELKIDGYRCLSQVCNGNGTLTSRQGNPLAHAFPDVVQALGAIERDVVMDAELAVDDVRGHQLFDVLRRRARMSVPNRIREVSRRYPARLYIFDLLAIEDCDVRALPLLERKRLLRDVFVDSGALIFVNGICGHGRAAFEQVLSMGLEGLVAKRLNSIYRSGRTRDWLKVINPSYHRRAAVLRGWHAGRER